MDRLKASAHRLLRKSEKYFKTDMVYLAQGGFWLTFGQVTASLSALILSIVFANFFPKHEFGLYKYVLSLAGVVGAFSLTGLGVAITRSVAKGIDGSLVEGFWMNLKWSATTVGISLIIAIYYFVNDNNTLAAAFVIIALASPIISSASLYRAFLGGKKDFKSISIYGLWRNIIPTLILILTILITDDLLLIIFTYFTSNLLIVIAIYFYTVKKYSLHKIEDLEMSSYAKHLSLINMLGIIAEHLDKIIVFQLIGSVQLAVYIFATAIPMQIRAVLRNIYHMAFPKFAAKSIEELKRDLPRKIMMFFLVSVPIVLLYILLAPLIFKTLFPKYTEAVLYSQVFAVSLLFYSTILTAAALQSKKMVSELYKASILTSLVKIISLVVLTYFFGLWGVIIARVLNEALSLLINGAFFFLSTKKSIHI